MRHLLPICTLTVLASACAHAPAGTTRGTEEGVASFYSPALAGRPTASGAPYSPDEMTCAHRKHRFGTRLRVTELASGRSVVVTVNDRGPFVAARVIDLSWAAARELGILERGVARVRLEPAR